MPHSTSDTLEMTAPKASGRGAEHIGQSTKTLSVSPRNTQEVAIDPHDIPLIDSVAHLEDGNSQAPKQRRRKPIFMSANHVVFEDPSSAQPHTPLSQAEIEAQLERITDIQPDPLQLDPRLLLMRGVKTIEVRQPINSRQLEDPPVSEHQAMRETDWRLNNKPRAYPKLNSGIPRLEVPGIGNNSKSVSIDLYAPGGPGFDNFERFEIPPPMTEIRKMPKSYRKNVKLHHTTWFHRKFCAWAELPDDERYKAKAVDEFVDVSMKYDQSMCTEVRKEKFRADRYQEQSEHLQLEVRRLQILLHEEQRERSRAEQRLRTQDILAKTLQNFQADLQRYQKVGLDIIADNDKIIQDTYDVLKNNIQDDSTLAGDLMERAETLLDLMDENQFIIREKHDIPSQVQKHLDNVTMEVKHEVLYELRNAANRYGDANIALRAYRNGLIEGRALNYQNAPEADRYREVAALCTQQVNDKWRKQYESEVDKIKESYLIGHVNGWAAAKEIDGIPANTPEHWSSAAFALGKLLDSKDDDELKHPRFKRVVPILRQEFDAYAYWLNKGVESSGELPEPAYPYEPQQPRQIKTPDLDLCLSKVSKILKDRVQNRKAVRDAFATTDSHQYFPYLSVASDKGVMVQQKQAQSAERPAGNDAQGHPMAQTSAAEEGVAGEAGDYDVFAPVKTVQPHQYRLAVETIVDQVDCFWQAYRNHGRALPELPAYVKGFLFDHATADDIAYIKYVYKRYENAMAAKNVYQGPA
ncbi:hypothetical protein IQ07DRAFT_643473 [Pyrenochaeta sp. DS3sAY3a]|nr:hypothetical protein IQ07DRAFT_643473 [Pyrenochaeta sp. DS3sAY3a]